MTLSGWTEARRDERPERFCVPGFLYQRAGIPDLRPLAICGKCLESDAIPFIRIEWMIGWMAVCIKHKVILSTHCPSCGAALRLPTLSVRRHVTIGRCRRCEHTLNGSQSKPAPDTACNMQARLLAIKHAGIGNLPGIGCITWSALVSLIDLILCALWRQRARYIHERLFARIVHDTGLHRDERLRTDWASNYGTMLLLAWLFAQWPKRLAAAMDLLHAPGLDELILLVTELGAGIDQQLETILRDIVPDRSRGAEDWRFWLESLPETGTTLRQRSKREFLPSARKRLRVLADLLDGLDTATAADRAGLKAVEVEHWLNVGLKYGLSALTAEQMRFSYLTANQHRAITGWLASVSRRAAGPNN
jgi:hypothetical protein